MESIATQKELDIKDKQENHNHEQKIETINNTHQENMAKINSENEKIKLENSLKIQQSQNQFKLDVENLEKEKIKDNNDFFCIRFNMIDFIIKYNQAEEPQSN